LFSIQKLNSK